MKPQIKIRYRLHCEDWAEETCSYEDDPECILGLGKLVESILNKRYLELDRVHMVMEQPTFNQLAYKCALGCVNIGESFEVMKEFNIVWLHDRYIPVYLE